MPDIASTIVLAFLAAMEQRDLEKARSYFVRKTIDSVHESSDEDHTTVYCSGTLAGEWPDGADFSGVRFIDRFSVRNGKLTRQDVWNDLAELRALR